MISERREGRKQKRRRTAGKGILYYVIRGTCKNHPLSINLILQNKYTLYFKSKTIIKTSNANNITKMKK